MVADTYSIPSTATGRRRLAVPLLAALTVAVLAAGMLALHAPANAVLASCLGLGGLLRLRVRLARRDLRVGS